MRDTGNVCFSLEPRLLTRLLVESLTLSCSLLPVTALELARYPCDADPNVARKAYRCETSDLGPESEVARSSAVEAEHH